MNNTNDIATEMADAMAEMQAEWEAEDAEKARRYRVASVFLADRMLDDLRLVKKRIHLKEAVGSYVIHQQKKADESLTARITDMENLVGFLKDADRDYFIGNDEKRTTNREAIQLFRMFADYFRGDCNNLKLAKISNDIDDFRRVDSSKSIADIVVISLEGSVPDIFKE